MPHLIKACRVLEVAVWTGSRVGILLQRFSARRTAHGARRPAHGAQGMRLAALERGLDAMRQVGLVAARQRVGHSLSLLQEAPSPGPFRLQPG